MAPDSRFFPPQGPFSAADLSSFSGAELVRSGGNTGLYLNVAALGSATDTDVSFLDNKLYKEQLGKTEAGCSRQIILILRMRESRQHFTPVGMTCSVPLRGRRQFIPARKLAYPQQ